MGIREGCTGVGGPVRGGGGVSRGVDTPTTQQGNLRLILFPRVDIHIVSPNRNYILQLMRL